MARAFGDDGLLLDSLRVSVPKGNASAWAYEDRTRLEIFVQPIVNGLATPTIGPIVLSRRQLEASLRR